MKTLKTLNEQIERLRELIRKCYGAVAGKNGTVPEVGERNMENLPAAIASTHDTLEELIITANGEYTPSDGVDGFSKVVANVVSTKRVVIPNGMTIKNTQIIDGYWAGELVDTSTMTSMNSMFYTCSSLQQVDVSGWDTSNAKAMQGLFQGCSSLQELNTKDWDVSNVTNMLYAFYGCSQLKTLDVSNWDMGNVTYADGMFYNCSSLQSLDVSNWDIRKMSKLNMFNRCSSLQSLDVSKWDLTNITGISGLFSECSALQSLDVSKWNTHNVTSMSSPFYNCSSLQTLDVSNWDVSNVTNMERLVQNCSSLQSLDLRNWDVSKVTSMTYSFLGMPSLKTFIGGLTEEQVDMTTVTCLNGLQISINLSDTTLDRASLRAIINGLADLTGQTAQTLTLGATLIAKLTEEDIAIATNKNWTIV